MLIPDSRGKIPLTLADSLDRSVELVKRYVHNDRFWKYDQEPYRKALLRLIWYLESNPVDSVVEYLKSFPYPLAVPEPKPQDSSQVMPEVLPSDTGSVNVPDAFSEAREKVDSLVVADSLVTRMPDSLALVTQDSINPDTISVDSLIHTEDSISKQNGVNEEHFDIFRDTLYTIYRSDTLPLYISDTGYVASLDSLREAVEILIRKVESDSVRLWVTNLTGDQVPLWLSRSPGDFTRFWLKNEARDSVGLWIRNLNRNKISLTLDDNVIFQRLKKKKNKESFLIPSGIADQTKLEDVRPIIIRKNPWSFGGVGAVNLSQGMLSNWAKGGESSISTLWEVNAFANYNKDIYKWSNNFRFKYGILKSGDKGVRKNEDLWELDSRFGLKKKKGTWYYSAALNLKSQIARGYKYPDDSTVVSKFFAPGYLYLSLGMDYRPKKKISVLMSPLTWKATFVNDTALIDQTRYGLKADRKTRQDIGAYVRSHVVYDFNKDMSLTGNLNLFSQYNSKPQNIDVDLELIYRLKLGPYFNVNVSTHMIYDDDIKFPVYDLNGDKIGVTPKLQFMEWLNIGFSYRF